MTETENRGSTGGCLCGAVRYQYRGDPLITAVCHCRHCQRQGGSAFSVVLAVLTEDYTQTGVTRVFEDRGDSGQAVHRHFCGTCGSPIVSIADAIPGLTIIKAGTLDDPSGVRPTQEAYCGQAWPVVPAFSGTERFPESNV
jgi:hypothetical protein